MTRDNDTHPKVVMTLTELKDVYEFLGDVDFPFRFHACTFYLGNRFGLKAWELTYEEIIQKLRDKGYTDSRQEQSKQPTYEIIMEG